jgi:hypothetical protein
MIRDAILMPPVGAWLVAIGSSTMGLPWVTVLIW